MFPKGYFRGVAEHTHALRPTVAEYLVPEMNRIVSTIKNTSRKYQKTGIILQHSVNKCSLMFRTSAKPCPAAAGKVAVTAAM